MDLIKRPVRIANCSGAVPDPGDHMYNQVGRYFSFQNIYANPMKQAKYGPVDVITGDYLAGKNVE